MIYIILPAYNEKENIASLIRAIDDCMSNRSISFVVIDDGSTDDTRDAALETGIANINLIVHGKNEGLGISLKDGFLFVEKRLRDDDLVITLDADNTHRPEYMQSMIDAYTHGAAVVAASRYAVKGKESGLPWYRSMCSRTANRIMKLLFPVQGVSDYTSGYRLYASSALKKGFAFYGNDLIQEEGFTCMAEILIKLSCIGVPCGEVPFNLRYDLKKSNSKMPVFKTICRYFKLWINLFQNRRKINKTIINKKEHGH